MSIWLEILILIILLSVIFVTIMENRNPLKTIAWVLLLIFLPVVGLILYLIFGMDTRHKRIIPDEKRKEFKLHTLKNYPEQVIKENGATFDRLRHLLYSNNGSILLDGNDVKPYINFDEMFEDQLHDIAEAHEHIHVIYFKFENDPVGQRLADLLIQKAREGVKVRLMYDDVANFTVSRKFYKNMKNAGLGVAFALPC